MESPLTNFGTAEPGVTLGEYTVCIPVSKYSELLIKANALDTLASDIRHNINNGEASYDVVNDNLVLILTGTKSYVKKGGSDE